MVKSTYRMGQLISDLPKVAKLFRERVKTHYQRRPFNGDSSEVIYTWQRGKFALPFTGGMLYVFDQLKDAYRDQTETVETPDRSNFMADIMNERVPDIIRCKPKAEDGKRRLTMKLVPYHMGRNTGTEAYDLVRIEMAGPDDEVLAAGATVSNIVADLKVRNPTQVVDKLWVGYGSQPNNAIEITSWFRPDSHLSRDQRMDLSDEDVRKRQIMDDIVEEKMKRMGRYLRGELSTVRKRYAEDPEHRVPSLVGPIAQKWVDAAYEYLIGSRDPEYNGARKGDIRSFLAAVNGNLPSDARLNWKQFQEFERKLTEEKDPDERARIGLIFFTNREFYGIVGLEELEALSHREYERWDRKRKEQSGEVLEPVASSGVTETSKPTSDSIDHEDILVEDMLDSDFLEEPPED